MIRRSLNFVIRGLILQNRIVKLLKKDFYIEFRSRASINISLAFAGITTLSVSLTSATMNLPFRVHSILIWVIIFFSAMNSLSHIFIREEEEDTSIFLSIHSEAEEIYIAKLLFNFILFIVITVVVTPLYLFFMQIWPENFIFFASSVFCGSTALSSITTTLGAIVAKTSMRSSLFTVISFPLTIPVLWISINLTASSLEGGSVDLLNLLFLLAFSGVIVSFSYLLFKFIWMEQ